MPTKNIKKAAEDFFYKNGGFGYDPKKETKAQGKRRMARDSAKAEEIAANLGWRFEWENDPEPYEMGDTEDTPPDEVLCVVLYDEKGNVLQSLGSIGLGPNSQENRNYKRVVEAELATEALHEKGLL